LPGPYTEPIPVFESWPDAPVGYLQLSPAYSTYTDEARASGWPTRVADAGHFYLLVDPEGVADLMLELLEALDV
jgi:hypothetical protein